LLRIVRNSQRRVKRTLFSLLKRVLRPLILSVVDTEIHVHGQRSRLDIAPTAQMVNTMFNTSSGRIVIGDFTFTGHNVSILTGTHQTGNFLGERLLNVPQEGCDVVVGRGVWLGSNATILGPCTIGDHAVVAAGAVVAPGTEIPTGAIVGGVPARVLKVIKVPPVPAS